MKQRILLLGGFGFLGTNILKYIDKHLTQQYQVIVFDKFNLLKVVLSLKHSYNKLKLILWI